MKDEFDVDVDEFDVDVIENQSNSTEVVKQETSEPLNSGTTPDVSPQQNEDVKKSSDSL